MNDDSLHRLLRQYPARAQLDSSFDREVWSRIEAESTRTFGHQLNEMVDRFFSLVTRPLAAAITFAVFALGGLVLGWQWHQKDMNERAAIAYQQAINPLYRAELEVGR